MIPDDVLRHTVTKEWYLRATDRSFMYPMLEMCDSANQVEMIPDILYNYRIYGQQKPEHEVEMSCLNDILQRERFVHVSREEGLENFEKIKRGIMQLPSRDSPKSWEECKDELFSAFDRYHKDAK